MIRAARSAVSAFRCLLSGDQTESVVWHFQKEVKEEVKTAQVG
jgi:hypothetical protein